VHSGGAGANNDTRQFVFGDRVLDDILSCLRTHILIIGGKNDAGFVFQGIGYCLHVNGACDITTTPTDKNTNSLHFVFPPYLFTVFSECADKRLLGNIFVQQCGNVVRGHMVCTLSANGDQTDCFHKLRGLYASGASFDASEAGQAFVQGFRIQKRLDLAVVNHADKLVRMVFHLAVSGASTGAFTATHTFFGMNTAHAQNFFLKVIIIHLYPPLLPKLPPTTR
jgi:hypothetical protein